MPRFYTYNIESANETETGCKSECNTLGIDDTEVEIETTVLQ